MAKKEMPNNEVSATNGGHNGQTNEAQTAKQNPSAQGTLARRQPESQVLSLALGDPFATMRRFSEEMDRVFDSFGLGRRFGWRPLDVPTFAELMGSSPAAGTRQSAPALWSPQIEMDERDGQLRVCVDLPGVKKEDVKVEILDDALLIQGERKQESEEKREGFYRSERSYGSFQRLVPLPEGANADNATANFKDGVLEITLTAPQREQKRNRHIEVT